MRAAAPQEMCKIVADVTCRQVHVWRLVTYNPASVVRNAIPPAFSQLSRGPLDGGATPLPPTMGDQGTAISVASRVGSKLHCDMLTLCAQLQFRNDDVIRCVAGIAGHKEVDDWTAANLSLEKSSKSPSGDHHSKALAVYVWQLCSSSVSGGS